MANFNYNKVILGGRLTADPELKTTPSGVPVTTFTIAVNGRFRDRDGNTKSFFIDVVAWRQDAEFVTRYFRKSSSICVTGELQSRNWVDQHGQKRYTVEVLASEVTFVDARAEMPGMRNNGDPPAPAGIGGERAEAEIPEEGSQEEPSEEMPF